MPDLRTILRWPLYSVRRIVGLCVVLLLAVAVVNMLGARDAERAERAAVDSPSPTPPPSRQDDRGADQADDGQEQQADDGQDLDAAMDTASAFVAAWAADVPYVQWMEGMEPYITTQFRESIRTGHPDNISVTMVERVQITQTGTAGRTSAAITTDAGMLSVTLVSYTAGQTWLVSGISPGAQPEPGS